MKYIKKIVILICSILFLSSQVYAVQVVLFGKYNGKVAKLRWLPKDKNLRYTYKLYRGEENGKNLKLISSLKKMSGKEAEKFLPKKYKGVKDFLYPLSTAHTKKEKLDIILQAEKIIDFQLLIADHDIKFAQALGIGYEDKSVERNKRYTYTLKAYNSAKKEIAKQNINISTFQAMSMLPVKNVSLGSKKFGVGVRWKYFNQYGAYNIYRKDKEKGKYIKLNQKPITINYKIDKNGVLQAPPYFFIDDTLKDYKIHYYTVKGIDFFGDESPSSLVESAHKIKPLPQPLQTNKPKYKAFEDKVILSWEKNAKKKVKFYNVYRSFEFNNNYKRLNKKPIKKLTFTDGNVIEKAAYYYRIDGISNMGIATQSVPALVIPWDNVAPNAPTNIKAKVEAGKVSLSWQKVKDKALLGYRVFRSFNPDKDMWYMLKSRIIKKEYIVDILPKSQDRKYYYYKVVALDKNQNISKSSKIIKIKLPDVTPPARPTIEGQSVRKKSIFITFKKSTSKDVLGYNIYRKIANKSQKINKKPINTLFYEDFQVLIGKKTSYAVTSVDKAGNESRKTDWVSAVYLDKIAPSISKFIIHRYDKSIKLEFVSKDKDIDGFRVYRSDDGKNYEQYSKYIKNSKVFIDKKIKSKTKYHYYIIVYDTSGNRTISKKKEYKNR